MSAPADLSDKTGGDGSGVEESSRPDVLADGAIDVRDQDVAAAQPEKSAMAVADLEIDTTPRTIRRAVRIRGASREGARNDPDSRLSKLAADGLRVPFLGVVAIGLAFLVAVSVLGYLYWQESDRGNDLEGTVAAQRQTEQDRSAALTAAKAFLVTANNIDYTNLDPWFKQMTERSTGAFRDSYQPVQSGIGEVIKASQLKIVGKVSQAAISSQTASSIRILALVDQTVQSVKLAKPTPVATAMYVDLMRDNGAWKVYGMNQAADQTVQSPQNSTGVPVPGAPAAPAPTP
ncbi:hypothetical protein [Gordonia sp. CPCC 205333]|uniref:hypothetical protein n=1 Tax=Gordonia sp. CPCC 205333 TaxID=3140790 RepID=UPI003AF3DF19